MSMITEQVEYLIKLSNKHPYDSNILTLQRACKEAAKTIEQLAAKVREDNAYQKAFEDIRAELTDFAEDEFHRPNNDYEAWAAVRTCLNIIDKHDPSKAGKENNG